jgi:nucleoside phosphorylase
MLAPSIQQAKPQGAHVRAQQQGLVVAAHRMARRVTSPYPIDVLIMAAYPPELSVLARTIGPGASSARSNTAEFRGTVGVLDVVGQAVGVGLPAAAVGSTRCLQTWRPRVAIIVGTCGAYDGSGLSIGDVVCARRVHLVSTASIEGRAGLPSTISTSCAPDAHVSSGFARLGLSEVDVATTLAVTIDDALARRVADQQSCRVEHLEAFSVGLACAAFAVPFAVVLAVANRVGPMGREQWKEHHTSAGEAAAGAVLRWLELFRAGLG